MKNGIMVSPKSDTAEEKWWALRLAGVAGQLQKNGFEVSGAADCSAAGTIFLERILPQLTARTVSFGGSMTLKASGVVSALHARSDLEIIDTLDMTLPPQEALERRRQALLSDIFLTGTNALTESGVLVNLDMLGNRVGAINFGPRHVVLFVGRNKLVPDVAEAMDRIKRYAAPANAMRLEKATPCNATSHCNDCSSPERICNVWTVTEKAFPKGRIHVILINEECGL